MLLRLWCGIRNLRRQAAELMRIPSRLQVPPDRASRRRDDLFGGPADDAGRRRIPAALRRRRARRRLRSAPKPKSWDSSRRCCRPSSRCWPSAHHCRSGDRTMVVHAQPAAAVAGRDGDRDDRSAGAAGALRIARPDAHPQCRQTSRGGLVASISHQDHPVLNYAVGGLLIGACRLPVMLGQRLLVTLLEQSQPQERAIL